MNNNQIMDSMTGSMMATSQAFNSCKINSSNIIIFIIDKLFAYYTQNNADNLINTLIPGYFNRILNV
jgi:hypothetical protein